MALEKENDWQTYFQLQEEMRRRVIRTDDLAEQVRYVAGADVAYNDAANEMVGAVVVLDTAELVPVEEAFHRMEITFPYIPGLFSFREIPPLLEAFRKLKCKPDLIICDGHGIAHPRGVGMATHLGIELDIPTIGCAKKRLVGKYDKSRVPDERGASYVLEYEGEVIGAAVRTQSAVKPMFVSIGHKISLETAIEWVLRLSPRYRLPETTRLADQLVNRLIKV